MKIRFILFVLILNTGVYAQNYSKPKLQEIQKELKNDIETLTDSLDKIETILSNIEKDSITERINEDVFIVKMIKEAKLRDEPNTYDIVLKTIPDGEKVKLTGISEKKGFYKACYEDKCGYLSDMYFKIIPEFQDWSEAIKIKLEKEKKLEEETKYQARLKAYKEEQEKLIKKYGKSTYEKLKAGKIWIGMTDEQCKISIGEPTKINRSVGSWGTHEQWIYSKSDVYLYFENGKLTSWQD